MPEQLTNKAMLELLVNQVRETNERSEKVYKRVFEDNGHSLISQVRQNKNDIGDLKTMQQQTFELVKSNGNGRTGKKIMGKDTGDIWKTGIRLMTVLAYIVASILGINFALFK